MDKRRIVVIVSILLVFLNGIYLLKNASHHIERARERRYPLGAEQRHTPTQIRSLQFSDLPAEARATVYHILTSNASQHIYYHDGSIFFNYEHKLPPRPKGYYHEFTVPTPGLNYRGPQRIVVGGSTPDVCYYTPDHYQTFFLIHTH